MLHLLKLEWLKQKDYLLFKMLAVAYAVFLPATLFIGKKLDFGAGSPINPKNQFFQFPTIWEWLGYIGSWMTYFMLGFLVVLMVTNEFSNRTLRQNMITGLKRGEFFKSKLAFMVVVGLAASLYYMVCALVIGLLHSNDTLYFSTIFKHVDLVPRFFLMSLGYMSFGLLVGLLFKRTGIALFIYLAYSMVGEFILRYVVHLYIFKNRSMCFYPFNAMEDLVPLPVADFADDLFKQMGFKVFLTPVEAIVTTSIYITLFLALSYKRLKSSDL